MSRKPTLDDALLLALSEAGSEGLDIIKLHLRKPDEFKASLDDFVDRLNLMMKDGLVDLVKFGDSLRTQYYKLTEKGKLKVYNMETEINQDDFISLVTRVSPDVEIRKRLENIETFLISSFFVVISVLELRILEPKYYPLSIYIFILFFYMILFVCGLIYTITSLARIVSYRGYYTVKYGKITNRVLIFYKNNEKGVNLIFRFLILPLIALLISIFILNMSIEYAIGTLILTIIGGLILKK